MRKLPMTVYAIRGGGGGSRRGRERTTTFFRTERMSRKTEKKKLQERKEQDGTVWQVAAAGQVLHISSTEKVTVQVDKQYVGPYVRVHPSIQFVPTWTAPFRRQQHCSSGRRPCAPHKLFPDGAKTFKSYPIECLATNYKY